jgi:hypothetical protein
VDSVDAIKLKIGNEAYLRLEKEAEKEVALAKGMPLVDQDQHETFYRPRFLLGDLRAECEAFQKAGLKILPTDIVNIQFRCKLLRAVQTEQEYRQRGGGVGFFAEFANTPKWLDRTENVDILIERYMAALEASFQERTLLTYISSFSSARPDESLQASFEDLFSTLGFPYLCFFKGEHLVERHKQFEPWLRVHDQATANEFFSAPSIGFRAPSGSSDYCFWYSSMWLRTFLNMLRIAGYIYPGQRDFGRDVTMTAPTQPVFLGQHAHGCYSWFEDKKQSWEKIPDGCLFRSFGYRGLSNMWLDFRTLPSIKRFMVDNRKIFENLHNPWQTSSINDVAPALDILNSATQIPDTGAKILLVYCCLEHLFVPKNVDKDNKKYIIGGINALAPHLLDWFNHLNNLRNGYAHKGFVLSDEKTVTLVVDSMRNVVSLLVAKLSV